MYWLAFQNHQPLSQSEVKELDAEDAVEFSKARKLGRSRPIVLLGPKRLPGPRPREIHGALCGRRDRP